VDQREERARRGIPRAACGEQDPRRPRVKSVQGGGTERYHEVRREQCELVVEVRAARPGRGPVEPVFRRMAFQHVQDSHPVLGEAEVGESGIENPARSTHERGSLPVLLDAGGLSDEHHVGREAPSVDHRLSTGPAERAELAGPNLLRKLLELLPYPFRDSSTGAEGTGEKSISGRPPPRTTAGHVRSSLRRRRGRVN
jgi:hypothetical protein